MRKYKTRQKRGFARENTENENNSASDGDTTYVLHISSYLLQLGKTDSSKELVTMYTFNLFHIIK